jgi:hypothetical protein
VTQRLRALDKEGNPGKYVQLEDALRLCRAAGFVRACDKEVTRTEDTEKTRMLFHQAPFNAKKVSDPKAFAKTILNYEENLNKTRVALSRAGDSIEDANATAVLSKHILLAEEVLNEFISRRSEGKKDTIREVAFEKNMPGSMLSKTLTGSIEVPPNGRLWTTLFGKELEKFCTLTLKELSSFEDEALGYYLPEDLIASYRALCDEGEMKRAHATTKELTEKQKEKYLEQPMPIRPFIGLAAMLKRAETTKAYVRLRQESKSPFPKIDAAANATMQAYYVCPPANISEVRGYWTALAGVELRDPDLVSAGYRAQTLESLEDNGSGETRALDKIDLEWEIYRWKGMPLHARTVKLTSELVRDEALEKYNPPEIVGFEKKTKNKDKQRINAIRKNDLTPESRRYMRNLMKNQIPPDTLKSVKEFLESFLYTEMQNLASHIVYLTCRMTLNKAQEIILHEGNEEEKDDDDNNEDDDDYGESDEDAAPLPAPLGDDENKSE